MKTLAPTTILGQRQLNTQDEDHMKYWQSPLIPQHVRRVRKNELLRVNKGYILFVVRITSNGINHETLKALKAQIATGALEGLLRSNNINSG